MSENQKIKQIGKSLFYSWGGSLLFITLNNFRRSRAILTKDYMTLFSGIVGALIGWAWSVESEEEVKKNLFTILGIHNSFNPGTPIYGNVYNSITGKWDWGVMRYEHK